MRDVALTIPGQTREEQLAAINQEIEDFSRYMCTLGDWKSVGPLNEMEKTLLRSYLVAKAAGKYDEVK